MVDSIPSSTAALVEDESNLLFNSTQENEVQNHVPR
jgi:hypothetical protein